jgi:hypothetical protein
LLEVGLLLVRLGGKVDITFVSADVDREEIEKFMNEVKKLSVVIYWSVFRVYCEVFGDSSNTVLWNDESVKYSVTKPNVDKVKFNSFKTLLLIDSTKLISFIILVVTHVIEFKFDLIKSVDCN